MLLSTACPLGWCNLSESQSQDSGHESAFFQPRYCEKYIYRVSSASFSDYILGAVAL